MQEKGTFVSSNPNPKPDYKAIIRQEWLDAAPLWKKWYSKLAQQSRAATELVLQNAQLAPGLRVLDIASGSGEPSLSIAEAVGPTGRVIATDLVPEMLASAQENSVARGLQNMEFHQADSEYLPFEDGEFDRVTCRFGIMFFPDIHRAFAEHLRVLKPGGRFSYVAWGPGEENPMFAVMVGPFQKRVTMPTPPPDSPHIFRFADEAKLASVLASAGFHDVQTAKHTVRWPWPGTAEEAWESTREIAAPFQKMIAALPPELTDEVHNEVLEGIRRYGDGAQINFPASLVSATGVA